TAIVADAIFLMIGVVRMGRSELVHDAAVILGALVGVLDQQADGGPCGATLEHARENLHLIGFLALGGKARGAGLASVQIALQVSFAQGQPRWATIYNATQGGAMAFAEAGHREEFADGVSGHL